MGDKSLGRIALRVDKRDVGIDLADALELVRVAVVVRTSVHADEEDSDVHPG